MTHDYVPQQTPRAAQGLTLFTIIVFCAFVYSGCAVLTVVYLAATGDMSAQLSIYGASCVAIMAASWCALHKM